MGCLEAKMVKSPYAFPMRRVVILEILGTEFDQAKHFCICLISLCIQKRPKLTKDRISSYVSIKRNKWISLYKGISLVEENLTVFRSFSTEDLSDARLALDNLSDTIITLMTSII